MMQLFHDPKTILGLRLKLASLLGLQWIGWCFYTFHHLPLVLDRDLVFFAAVGSSMFLAGVYGALWLLVLRGLGLAKTLLTYVNLALLAAALYLPFFPKLLEGRGVLDLDRAPTAVGKMVSWEVRLYRAESVFNIEALWPNLLIILGAGLILNLLREHTFLGLWDRSHTGDHVYGLERISVGNSLIFGIFAWLTFYAALLVLPNSSLLLPTKRLFFGEHALYYVQMLVFWWATALLVIDYRVVRGDQSLFDRIRRLFAQRSLRRIDRSEALSLLKELESSHAPLDRSQVSHRVGRVLESLVEHDSLDSDGLLQRLEDIEYRARESDRSFLGTLLWSLPLLGFMGTIIGIIRTITVFSGVLTEQGGSSELVQSLRGLSIAFETTLLGLVTALIGGYLMGLVRQRSEYLDVNLSHFCEREILAKVSVTAS